MHSSRISVTPTSIAQAIIKYFVTPTTSAAAFDYLIHLLPEIKQQLMPASILGGFLHKVTGDTQEVLLLDKLQQDLTDLHNKELRIVPDDDLHVIQMLFLFLKNVNSDSKNISLVTAIIWAILQKMQNTNNLSLMINADSCKKIIAENAGRSFIDAFEVEVKIVIADNRELRKRSLTDAEDSAEDEMSSEHDTIFEDSEDLEPETRQPVVKKQSAGSIWHLFGGLPLIFGDVSDVFVHQVSAQQSASQSDEDNSEPESDAEHSAYRQRYSPSY